MCNCITEINQLLAEKNTNLLHTFPLKGGERQIIVATEKNDSAKRGKPITVIASFCPFCGIEYGKQTTQSDSKG